MKDSESLDITPAEETSGGNFVFSHQIRCTVSEEGENRLALTGVLDGYLAEELHRCALDLLESGRNIAIDLTEVDSMDVSSIQILLALRTDLIFRDGKLVISAASANAARSLHTAGIAGIFAVA